MVRRAGNFYDSVHRQRFADRDLDLYAAVGDHDIGDNPWDGRKQAFKREHVGLSKQLFGKWFTRDSHGRHRFPDRPRNSPWEDTAYATHLAQRAARDRRCLSPDREGRALRGRRQAAHLASSGPAPRGDPRTPWVIVQATHPSWSRSATGPVEPRSRRRRAVAVLADARGPRRRHVASPVRCTTPQSATVAGSPRSPPAACSTRPRPPTCSAGVRRPDGARGPRLDGEQTGERGKLWQLGAHRTNGSRELTPAAATPSARSRSCATASCETRLARWSRWAAERPRGSVAAQGAGQERSMTGRGTHYWGRVNRCIPEQLNAEAPASNNRRSTDPEEHGSAQPPPVVGEPHVRPVASRCASRAARPDGWCRVPAGRRWS